MGWEAKVEAEFIKRLPIQYLAFKLNLQGNRGWPDRMILFNEGYVAFIEFKAPGSPLTGDRNQPERIAELRNRGYPVLVTDSADAALAWLEALAVSDSWRQVDDIAGLRGLAP